MMVKSLISIFVVALLTIILLVIIIAATDIVLGFLVWLWD